MKKLVIIFILFLGTIKIYGQIPKTTTVDFFGKELVVPKECPDFQQGMLKCETFALFWFPVQTEEFERHKEEMADQMKGLNASKIQYLILDKEIGIYKYKIDKGFVLTTCEKIENTPTILTVWVPNDIESSKDFPEFLQQIFKVKFK